ncbi:hypothetical protein NDU88_001085 [Pleurodeles waltl]|uniref:Uncharacterized protein n=1 Tax=Pleurodeles waltl TaxID=8319 RepID=A0AAV7PBI0_PLEWA|nr:hypothetical protein NDU88_001085 [Pleurodeles waltl]
MTGPRWPLSAPHKEEILLHEDRGVGRRLRHVSMETIYSAESVVKVTFAEDTRTLKKHPARYSRVVVERRVLRRQLPVFIECNKTKLPSFEETESWQKIF